MGQPADGGRTSRLNTTRKHDRPRPARAGRSSTHARSLLQVPLCPLSRMVHLLPRTSRVKPIRCHTDRSVAHNPLSSEDWPCCRASMCIPRSAWCGGPARRTNDEERSNKCWQTSVELFAEGQRPRAARSADGKKVRIDMTVWKKVDGGLAGAAERSFLRDANDFGYNIVQGLRRIARVGRIDSLIQVWLL